jgi:adenine-specific DNA-methyltransferase
MDGFNTDISAEQKQKLKELFPEVFTEDRIDLDRLKATLGEEVDLGERYGLNWKGKSGVFAKIQEKTTSTLHPQPEESIDWDTTQNMFIEGDNLEALKVLHKAYYSKIKMIYIDPPYNTGNDFVYNDDFKKTRREQALEDGVVDEEGNVIRDDGLRVNTGGHKHSNWLDMMYPRLFLARNLLRQDGVIFVSIDDNEVHNLRLMMNEIFGEENFQGNIHWRRRTNQPNDPTKMIGLVAEHILVYTRSSTAYKESGIGKIDVTGTFSNPDNDSRGPWASKPWKTGSSQGGTTYSIELPNGESITEEWMGSRETYDRLLNDGRIYFPKSGVGLPRKKYYLSERQDEGQSASNWWPSDIFGNNQEATTEQKLLFDGKVVFENPKPTKLIKTMLDLANVKADDIVLDFFGGSGTTAQAVAEYNHDKKQSLKTITIQLNEDLDKNYQSAGSKSKQIIKNAIELLDSIGKPHYISELAKERIRRVGAKIDRDIAGKTLSVKSSLNLGFRSYILGDSNFKKWNEFVADSNEIKQQALDSLNPLEDGTADDDLLTEILLKRGISPLVEVEMHNSFAFVPSENQAISLARYMTEELFAEILTKSPSQIILLDSAFRNDMNQKTNLTMQAERRNIVMEIL